LQAVREGTRVFSAYELRDGTRIWIITEADRSVTTILLPEEYYPPLTITRIGVGLNPLHGLCVCGQFDTTASTRDSARSST
jgi:hypothetical protein